MNTVLKVENIAKQYRLGLVGAGTVKHDLNRFWHKIRGKEDPYLKVGGENDRSKVATEEYVWALRDINFEVKEGEVLGIIGKNGAGKSTLLKLLSRVTSPTIGTIKSKGRIASLLEVGTGFHPELTGRENIYLNGAILGMTKAEIANKIDEIIEFSGCELYIDTPTKRYSSGMTVRLAFAVAAHLEPDIMVVDEVLAVGDAEFQKKAIEKMQEISTGEGRTVLFVSHNMASVKKLCTRGIVLENGKIVFEGSIDNCIQKYIESDDEESIDNKGSVTWSIENAPGSQNFKVTSVSTRLPNNEVKSTFLDSQTILLHIEANVLKPIRNMRLNLTLLDKEDVVVFTSSSHSKEVIIKEVGMYRYKIAIPKNLLNFGTYTVTIQAGVPKQMQVLEQTRVISFDIEKVNDYGTTINAKLPGVVAPKIEWEIEKK